MKQDIEVENQRPNEEIILSGHPHPWTLAKTGLWVLLIGLVAVVVFLIFKSIEIRIISVIIALILVTVILVFRGYIYVNTLFVITNERIIYIEQSRFFNRRVQETELVNMYNLGYKTQGFWQSLLNYGEVRIVTEGDFTDCIVIKDIENPSFIHEKLSHLHNLANKQKTD